MSEIDKDIYGRFYSRNGMLYKYSKNFLNCINAKSNKLEFINSFFGIKATNYDIESFYSFIKVLRLRMKKLSSNKISKTLNLSRSTVDKWLWKTNLPRLAKLLEYYTELGNPPSGMKWISINSTRGGMFTGKWICVPEKITSFKQVLHFLNQLEFSEEIYVRLKQFELKDDMPILKPLLFSYVLGVLVGDAGKCPIERSQRVTRRISLSLTKKYETNKRFGEFVALCVNSLGLKMKRIKDSEPGRLNKHPFFRWCSQSSELIEWIFNVCLGLESNQLTTYDAVKLDWILKCPSKFKIWFLQGLADSDGYVDFNSFQAGIVSQPNTVLIKNIIGSLGVRSSIKIFRNNLEAVIVSIENAHKIPLFSPIVNNYRYSQMKKLANASKLSWHMSEDLREKIKEHLSSGLSGSSMVKEILDTYNIRVRSKSIRRLQNSLRRFDK